MKILSPTSREIATTNKKIKTALLSLTERGGTYKIEEEDDQCIVATANLSLLGSKIQVSVACFRGSACVELVKPHYLIPNDTVFDVLLCYL